MAAHRYWRVRFTYSNGGLASNVWLAEVAFRDVGATDITVGGQALSGGDSSATYAKEHAFDKSLASSGWAGPAGYWPSWIGYDFGASVEVDHVTLTLPTAPGANDELPVADAMFVDASDDGSNWFPIGPAAAVTGWIALGAAVTLRTFPVESLTSLPVQPFAQGVQVFAPPPSLNEPPIGGHAELGACTYPPAILLYGTGTVAGTLKVGTLPARRLVRLFERGSGVLVRETMSGLDGSYRFEHLDTGRQYFAVGFDDPVHFDPAYNAAVADMLRSGVAT